MFEFLLTLILAMLIMVILSCIGVLITQPIHGALVRLRANYSPKAVSLDGLENRCALPAVDYLLRGYLG